MNPAENYISKQPESYQSIMLYVRSVIKKTLSDVEEKLSYGIPFYYYNKKPMLYLNVLRGTNYVDVSFMDGKLLEKDFPQLQDYKDRKRVRSIQAKSLEDFNENEFVKILKSAALLIDKKKL